MTRISQRWVPDPFVLALLLTFLVLGLALARAFWTDLDDPVWTVAQGWYDGVRTPSLLAFALQMSLILVTGHALALTPAVQRGIVAIARLPRNAADATVLVALVACASALIHWGLGAIAGALLAREIGRHAAARGLRLHYPLLGAAAYAGLAVWHGGLSGSAPLTVAKSDHFAIDVAGVVPMSATVGSATNLVITGVLVALIVAVLRVLTPRADDELVGPEPTALSPLPDRQPQPITSPLLFLQESNAVGVCVGVIGLALVLLGFASGRFAFDLDSVILLFLFLGIMLQGGLRYYAEAIADGARGAGAIILQFPFYFGILGMMKASGMVQWVSDAMVEVSSQTTLPVLAFLSAGLVNMAVPSGGGQWSVQGEILLGAGERLGVDPGVTVLAFSYGDAWTNMLQPFWALPLLGIMGLRARDIVGYTAAVFLALAVAVPVLLLLVPRLLG